MSSGKTEKIYGINGPVIYLKGKTDFKMSEMVHVGEEKLVGEVISLDKDITTVQVYEETSGLKPGEIVEASGSPVSVTLAPGILNNIFDGIERPLEQDRKCRRRCIYHPRRQRLIRLTATNYGIPTSPWPKEIIFMAEIL